MDVGGYATAGFSSGTEAFASDIEPGTVKKEKKKKKVKNKELLHHREKVHPEKIKRMTVYILIAIRLLICIDVYPISIQDNRGTSLPPLTTTPIHGQPITPGPVKQRQSRASSCSLHSQPHRITESPYTPVATETSTTP